ncbi:MAG: DUF2236 domain-containing protein [Armatimonadetes bacterium]|nr:DUF2236 domain-containing protein [Armatimonadota bacterium]
MGRFDILRRIETMDPERDHQQIYHLTTGYEFSWDTTRALEVALYRTYCVPSISGLLAKTGNFLRAPQKRYDDTTIIVAELSEHGYASGRGLEALKRMNRIHGHFNISNDDYLYVLSTFIYEPIRWMQRFGWRAMTRTEELASYCFWREVGKRMGIKDIPPTYEAFYQFSQQYEQKHFRFDETNKNIGEATRDLFAAWFPRFTKPMVHRGIYAMLDDSMLEAFGFPKPVPLMRRIASFSLWLRGRIVRYLLPARKKPLFFHHRRNRTYPSGYAIAQLGPDNLDQFRKQRAEEI